MSMHCKPVNKNNGWPIKYKLSMHTHGCYFTYIVKGEVWIWDAHSLSLFVAVDSKNGFKVSTVYHTDA